MNTSHIVVMTRMLAQILIHKTEHLSMCGWYCLYLAVNLPYDMPKFLRENCPYNPRTLMHPRRSKQMVNVTKLIFKLFLTYKSSSEKANNKCMQIDGQLNMVTKLTMICKRHRCTLLFHKIQPQAKALVIFDKGICRRVLFSNFHCWKRRTHD